MPSKSLPSRPNLDHLKYQAKDLLKAFKTGNLESLARIREFHPKFVDQSEHEIQLARFSLSDAQLVVAREYGFKSWSKLKVRVRQSNAQQIAAPVLEEFRHAFDARNASKIRELLQQHPSARATINEPLFPFDTPALVHVAGQNDLALVNILLEFGADPNRRSDWWAGGFHVLHSARGAVADRLLEAGAVPDACAAAHLNRPEMLCNMLDADPSRVHERGGDGQTPLHFARSREVVDLLLERGADPDARDLDHRGTPAQWMLGKQRGAGRYDLAVYLIEHGATADIFLAASLGLTEPLRVIIESDRSLLKLRTGQGKYGEKPPGSFHIYTWTIGQNLSPLQVAAQFEQDEVLKLLQAYASPKDRFIAASAQGQLADAKQLLHEWPGLIDRLTPDDQRILPDAGWAANAASVEAMFELGFDAAIRGQDGGTVLHCAAWQGAMACVEIALRYPGARALVNQPDPTHGSTPLGWCCHGACHNRNPDGDYPAVTRLLLEAGAKPGPSLEDATEEILAAIQEYEERRRNP